MNLYLKISLINNGTPHEPFVQLIIIENYYTKKYTDRNLK